MDVTLHFGIHRYHWLMELGRSEGSAFHLLRRELDGTRFLAQVWSPRPAGRTLDQIRDTFLSRFLDASSLDPVLGHFGFDGIQAWYLQAIQGVPMARVWAGWGSPQREAALEHLFQHLQGDLHPRLLHPEVITFRPGLTQIPRVIGKAPWGLETITGSLPRTAPAPALNEDLPWSHPRGFSEPFSRPLRGRDQELPYLKSLVLGFRAPAPMERIVLLQGEEGVGKEHLAAWACAVAEGEGIWVHHLAASTEESPGRFLGRLLESLLTGHEAEFYADNPSAAKTLALRLQAFAFLLGGPHPLGPETELEPEEVRAAIEALGFASSLHTRLIHLSGLNRATPEVLTLVRELAHATALPWLLSLTTGAPSAGLRPLISKLQGEPAAAVVGLNRLDDGDLRLVLEDLLGPHALPSTFRADLVAQSLGNPGLLRNLLELAQQSEVIVWDGGQWCLAPGPPVALIAEQDLVRQIFLGRLQRLSAASSTLVRLLALAERPLPVPVLGRLLSLPDDALDDALLDGVGSSLVQVQHGEAMIPNPPWCELVLAQAPPAELKRLARALSTSFQEQGWDCPVALQSLALDETRALAAVLTSLDQGRKHPGKDVQRLVRQALLLKPEPLDEARLHEHLADAWGTGRLYPAEVGSSPMGEALHSLERALDSLSRSPVSEEVRLLQARLHRKCAMLRLQLRQPIEAQKSLQAASERLADHPLHPEHSRLKLALGQLHLLQGHHSKGIRALEEGLNPEGGITPTSRDQSALLRALGKTLGSQSQLLRAASMLQSAQRLLEPARDVRDLVPVQIDLAQVRLAQGQPEACILLLREALQAARFNGDLALQAQAHFGLGRLRSIQQLLGPAQSHLDRALSRADRMGDAALRSLIQIWRARTLAALGELVAADHAQFEALASKPACLSPEEQGDLLFLQAEVARFRSAWRDAARLFKAAADTYDSSGLVWHQRMAQLRGCQALAREIRGSGRVAPEQDWTILEDLKGPVEGSDSRWLDLEWHRAHALLLATVPATESVVQETLEAWSAVQTGARDLQFHAQVLEASTEGAQLLLRRSDRPGARARMQEAFPSFQQLWTCLPEGHGSGFLGREDMHRFRQTVEAVGLRFIQPEPIDALVDWAPTQVDLPVVPDPE